MITRILEPADQPALEVFLLPRLVTSMFLLSNSRSAGMVDQGQPFQGTYAAAFDGEQMIGVVAHYWRGSLVLQAPLDLLEGLWRTAVSVSKRDVNGVMGPKQQVQTVVDALELGPSAMRVDEPEFLYELPLADLQVPAPLLDGRWRGRLINLDDVDLITAWRVGYVVEAMGETDSPQLWRRMREDAQRSAEQGRSWILEDNGRAVAMSSFNSRIAEAVQVGGVWTPPELRSRGYGRGAVAASLLGVRKDGVQTAVLFTGEENYPAQKAYVALGFRHIGDYRIAVLKEAVRP